jgi:hypothetical protein
MLRRARGTFPVGTMIVKEKRKQAKDPRPVLLTVMRKRAPAFDPPHGDWAYEVYTRHWSETRISLRSIAGVVTSK